MHINIFSRLSFLSLFIIIVGLPFFFLPGTKIPLEISKGLFLVGGLSLAVIFWAIARFFDGKIVLPKSATLLSGFGIVLVFFLSALFSKFSQVSFFGTMLDVGSFWFIFAAFILMFMSSIIFRDSSKAKILLFGVILSTALVLVFQTLHLFLPQFLSLGFLLGKTDNILGSWSTLGIFAGFSGVVSLLVVEFLSTTRTEKTILQTLVVLSMLIIAAVNFPLVWVLFGIFSLIIFVYKVSVTSSKKVTEGEGVMDFPAFSFFVVMVSLLFFISGSFVGEIIPNRLGLSNNEFRLPLETTITVAKGVIKENPILGIGPNRFGTAWSMYKPAFLNSTRIWDTSFDSGSGTLPTLATTTGILGILSLFIFFVLFIWSGIKSIMSSIKTGTNWEIIAFFILSLYLFVSSFFYGIGMVMFLLAFAFAGIFIGLSSANRHNGEISVSFLTDHRKSFLSILSLILVMILSAIILFKYIERFSSVPYFRGAINASTMIDAEINISKALNLHTNDVYLRAYSEIYLVKFNSLVQKSESLSEQETLELQASLDQAINGAQEAIKYDGRNYLNFKALGSVYHNATLFGVKDTYEKAIEMYTKAGTLNPYNPGIKLSMASLSIVAKKMKEAKEYANAALTLKPNYLDALLVLSQIAKVEGENALAISYAERALALFPSNEDLKKYVNSLRNNSSQSIPAPIPQTTIPTPSKKTE